MKDKRHVVFRAVTLAMVLVAPLHAQATQESPTSVGSDAPEPGQRDRLGWHVVRPNETLESITEHYLGTGALWRDNWKLNPDLEDPHFLRIGRRLRIILERTLPARTAEIRSISNNVEEKPQPNPWTPARVGSLLKERDGVRTHEDSSAELGFDDDSRLLITEQSLVFLREMSASVTGVSREAIEIVEGQADVEARPSRRSLSEIEIVMGEATAKPRPGAGGLARTRARRPQTGGAAVMVFGGQAEVEASGSRVDVPSGMGTSVPEGGAPAPPERLLPAPRVLGPADRSNWSFANPAFSWTAVDDAASYTIEVCTDEGCGELVQRTLGITETAWNPEGLPLGSLYWRVNAVSASGLDGFSSQPLALSINSPRLDREPPVVVAALVGTGVVRDEGGFLLGDGGRIILEARDDASGPAEVRYRWNGGPWEVWNDRALRPPTSASGERHRLEVEAVDRLGRQSLMWSVDVTEDVLGPPPPRVEADTPRELPNPK